MAEQKLVKKISLKGLRFSKPTLTVVFFLAIGIIFLISLFSYQQMRDLMKSNSWVAHTYMVIQNTDGALTNILDIETRQRAYLITGDRDYLNALDDLKFNLNTSLTKLQKLTNDNSNQSTRVQNFIKIVQERLDKLQQTVQLKAQNKLNTAEGTELFSEGQELSTRVKYAAREIQSVESVLLDQRTQDTLRDSNRTTLLIIIGNIVSIFLLVFAFGLANNELSISLKEKEYRRNIETRLRSIIESTSDMIAAIDLDYRFIIFNQAFSNEFKVLFGKSISVGASLVDILADLPEEKNKILEAWSLSLQGQMYTRNIDFMIGNEQNTYEMTSSFVTDENGKINGAVQIVRNITARIKEKNELQESYEKLNLGMLALEDKNNQITTLVEMSDIMLASNSQKELSEVMPKYCQRMLNFSSGYLYVMHPSKNYLEVMASWGEPHKQELTFLPDECWAIRLGRVHQVGHGHAELICNHIKNNLADTSFICVPLMAQNDIYGLLYLEIIKKENVAALVENQRLFIYAFAELTALALANVRLRENLRYQSIRDPLTGLYNRRYLDDFLLKQIHQSERNDKPITLLMLDLDHFKKINDTYGHEAGDMALKEVGVVLQENIRMGDIASRYGGEEFLLMFYDTNTMDALKRAESIRTAVSMLNIHYGAQSVGPITISIGVSEFPQDGKTPVELTEAADKALYIAKNTGRNKIVVYSEIKDNL